ncbi:MAG TPA: DoxX family protein [Longimicrobiales bacterium]
MQLLNAIPSSRQTTVGLFLIRLVLGTIFLAHGAQKVFAFGVSGFSAGLAEMGVPLPALMGGLVVLAELVGGIAVVLGLLTRVAALGIVAVMAGAIGLVHWPNGFFAPDGFEFNLMLMGAAVGLIVMGAGAWSLDAILSQRADRRTPSQAGAPPARAARAA